ncbi:galactose mutarotase-like domain-containing protein [Pelagophyceae sp. CCMP2097]|nr:galactose mutarotase-like domain-containing protein [Pelagophyceae sp. CCMP2097]|mmetsp:Transcript_10426/g.36147  ORF Transcript_10426/g.36147 Transcript_10426/m.36147 type:complete len:308 (-) Transcript_10426:63-986(-)
MAGLVESEAATATLPHVRLSLGGDASAEVALFGATVLSWRCGGAERLWVSSLSAMDGSAPIRGGVPIAFPQFADDGPLPLHGFARVSQWTLVDETNDDNTATATFELLSPQAIAGWGGECSLRYTVSLTRQSLHLELKVENVGYTSFDFTACLHTYLRVSDVRDFTLVGLEGLEYYDKVANVDARDDVDLQVESAARASGNAAGAADLGFVDRIYKGAGARSPLMLTDEAEAYDISQAGFRDTIVFNPWLEGKKGQRGPDFDDVGYKNMLCVEPAETMRGSGPVTLSPEENWTGSQTITIRQRKVYY